MLQVFHFLHEFRDIQELEKLVIKKITIIAKGESPEPKAAICNVPVNVADVCITLRRSSDFNGFVFVKFKRILQYRDYIILNQCVQVLSSDYYNFKLNYPLYLDFEVNISNIPTNLVFMSSIEVLLNNIKLLGYKKFNDPIPLTIKRSSVQSGSNTFSDQKMVTTVHFIQYNSPIPIVTKAENIVNMDSFGTAKIPCVDHNSKFSLYKVKIIHQDKTF